MRLQERAPEERGVGDSSPSLGSGTVPGGYAHPLAKCCRWEATESEAMDVGWKQRRAPGTKSYNY